MNWKIFEHLMRESMPEDQEPEKLVQLKLSWPRHLEIDFFRAHQLKSAMMAVHSDDKSSFCTELINYVRKIALENINIPIDITDLESGASIFFTKSCETFREKFYDCTGINLLRVLEVANQPRAELYFFVESTVDCLIFKRGEYDQDAVDSLYARLINTTDRENEKLMQAVGFVGRIDSKSEKNVDKFLDCAVEDLLRHIEKQIKKEKKKKDESNMIDLTAIEGEAFDEISDEVFCEFNTSELMEIEPEEVFYCKETQSLAKGWDVQVDMDRYCVEYFDRKLMEQYIEACKSDEAEPIGNLMEDLITDSKEPAQTISVHETEAKHESSDEDVTFVEEKPKKPAPKLRESSTAKINRIEAVPRRSSFSPYNLSIDPLREIGRRRETRILNPRKSRGPIHSKLFSQDQVEIWNRSGFSSSGQKAGKDDMKKLVASVSKEYGDIDKTLKYKIPKKTSDDAQCRNEKREKLAAIGMSRFTDNIRNVPKYSSPGTPESVASFFNQQAVEIDCGDENNNEKNDEVSSQPQRSVKRQLLDISENNNNIKLKKIFKSRDNYDNQISSSSDIFGTGRRKK